MANLSNNVLKGNRRVYAFEWYVTNNPRYAERDYVLDVASQAYTQSGLKIKKKKDNTLPAGTSFRFTSNQAINQKYAQTSLGLIPIANIRIPPATTKLLTNPNISEAINDYILEQGCPINFQFRYENLIFRNISYSLDKRITAANPRSNIILCPNNSNSNSINASPYVEGNRVAAYISYRPRNPYVSSNLTSSSFNSLYVSEQEYTKNSIYQNTDGLDFAKVACFGPDALKVMGHSLRNIHCFASGKPYIRSLSDGNLYELTFDGIYLTHNNISPSFLKTPYAPISDTKNKKTRIVSKVPFI